MPWAITVTAFCWRRSPRGQQRAGDFATRADARPAREGGWRTALIVPELGDDGERPDFPCPEGTAGNGWGGIFRDENGPTRFARTVSETADVFAARVEQIVSVGPGAVLPGVESSF